MNELFGWLIFISVVSSFIISIQAMSLFHLSKWNKELRQKVEELKPPF